MPKSQTFHVVSKFSSLYPKLRQRFENRFQNPRQASNDRFCWDYWHVPNQYTLLRTPAESFFPPELFQQLQIELCDFARNKLGCLGITPLWLSLYVEGCRQEWHADVPHGPWAFVYSLTPWQRKKFTGGETVLLQPDVLEYWKNLSRFDGVESKDLLMEFPAYENQLLVFDARLPHRVNEVRGVSDPLDGRLVLHGWFTDPEPYFEGTLTRNKMQKIFESLRADLEKLLPTLPAVHGLYVLRLTIQASGEVSRINVPSNTLRALSGNEDDTDIWQKHVKKHFQNLKFPKSQGLTTLTYPLTFRF